MVEDGLHKRVFIESGGEIYKDSLVGQDVPTIVDYLIVAVVGGKVEKGCLGEGFPSFEELKKKYRLMYMSPTSAKSE